MDLKEILFRLGYVRNAVGLSAAETSKRIGKSTQYVAQVESGRIVLTVKTLFEILEVCNFPVERFFSKNIEDYQIDNELYDLIQSLPEDKKRNLTEFLKK